MTRRLQRVLYRCHTLESVRLLLLIISQLFVSCELFAAEPKEIESEHLYFFLRADLMIIRVSALYGNNRYIKYGLLSYLAACVIVIVVRPFEITTSPLSETRNRSCSLPIPAHLLTHQDVSLSSQAKGIIASLRNRIIILISLLSSLVCLSLLYF